MIRAGGRGGVVIKNTCLSNTDNAAVADLGTPEKIGQFFAGFQKYLYQPQLQARP